MATTELQANPAVRGSADFLKDLFAGVQPRDLAVRFWDGSVWAPDPGTPANFTLVLNHPGSVRNMFFPPRFLSVGEAYLYNDFDIDGDAMAFCRFFERVEDYSKTFSVLQQLKMAWRLWRMPKVDTVRTGRQNIQLDGAVHSRERDRKAISFHYDLSNEFFRYILGPQMVYTCAVFDNPDEGLDAAQERKVDLICRKLRIQPGERFLDIGCGWGGLVIHAAKHYGAKSVGVTISHRQAEWCRRRIEEEGLQDRCRIDLIDYRDIDEKEPFDKIATIEVIEHFGGAQFPTYFKKCWRLLRPQGSLFVQQITLNDPKILRRGSREFGQAYIFPDGEFVSTALAQSEAEKVGFEIRDVESFREHYGFTLKHWLANLEANHDAIVAATDETAYRAFRLYFAGGACMGMFNSQYNLYQMLFVKSHPYLSGYPLSRQDWYPR